VNTVSAFFTEEECSSKPWLRLLADPSLICPYGGVDHHALQRLKPHNELDDAILGSYITLCSSNNQDERVKLLSTYFWAQISGKKKDYNGATRTLSSALVITGLSMPSFLLSI
jgi:hypothetical protein